LRALGRVNTPNARKQVSPRSPNEQPWVRQVAVEQMGHFQKDEETIKRLQAIYKDDKAIPCVAQRCNPGNKTKAPARRRASKRRFLLLRRTTFLRRGSLRAMGPCSAYRRCSLAVGMVLAGKTIFAARHAIGALGRLDLKNHDITARLISYLNGIFVRHPLRLNLALAIVAIPPLSSRSKHLLKTGNSPSAYRTRWEADRNKLKNAERGHKDPPAVRPENQRHERRRRWQ